MELHKQKKESNVWIKDYVPWFHIDEHNIVFNTNGSFQITFSFSGMDFTNATVNDMDMFIGGLNNAIKGLPEGYTVYFELQRNVVHKFQPSKFKSSLLSFIESKREEYFNKQNFYESKTYLTLLYKPSTDMFEQMLKTLDQFDTKGFKDIASMFGKGNSDFDEKRIKALQQQLYIYASDLQKTASLFMQMLSMFMDTIQPLTKEETLTYLHSQVSPYTQKISGNYDDFLSYYLCDSSFIGGAVPTLGDYYLGIVSIIDFPKFTSPFIMASLHNLKSEFRYVTRYITLTREEAIKHLKSQEKKFVQQAKGLGTMVLDKLRGTESYDIDTQSIKDATDTIAFYENVASDNVSAGYFTGSVVLYNKNKQTLEEDIEKVLTLIHKPGFIARKEYTNIENAFYSSITGCYQYNIRSYLMKSSNFIHCSPLYTKWMGDKENEFFKEKGYQCTNALYQGVSAGNVPFYLNLHQKDIGHTLIIGPNGSGKSVLLNTIEANYFKYDNAKIFVFDKAASCKVLCKAIGGNFYNLLVDTDSLNFQPLANIGFDSNNRWNTEMQWTYNWLCDFFQKDGDKISETQKTIISNALERVALLPKEQRTISALQVLMNDYDLKERLTIMTEKGVYGNLFDNTEDKFGTGNFQVFEMEELMANKQIMATTLSYMFHKITMQLTGEYPALIVLDESWLFLDNPIFKEQIRSFLKDLRKKNAAVVMATQNLTDLKEDMINVIVENVHTRIFLPNNAATAKTVKPLYENFGLNDVEIDTIRSLQPKRDYFYSCPTGRAIFRLDLQPIEIAFYGATSKDDQLKVDQLKHLSTSDFIETWIEYKERIFNKPLM